MLVPILFAVVVLGAAALGWYLASRQYKSHINALETWVLRLISDYSQVADNALHMRREGFEANLQYEAARDAEPIPELSGALGEFVDKVEGPAQNIIRTQAIMEIARGVSEAEVLDRISTGVDPYWALSR